jgi:iron complex outermembrane receptor protein
MAALSRIEILKEGAAATYGSDAIAGVVNFITDSTFEGLKVNIGAKGFQGAESEGKEFGLTYGTLIGEDVNFVMSLAHQFKPQIAIKDTNFGIRPFTQNTNGGWSTMGNPGTYVYPGGGTAAALGNNAFLSDPGCNNAGGLNTSFALLPGATKVNGDEALTGFCRYQYTYFDNVQEEQNNTQLWMEFNGAIDAHDWHVEFSYGHTDVPNWATSPSYPPNNPSTNTVPDHNPGFVQLLADNPTFAAALTDANYGGDGTNIASAHRVRTRTMAAGGNPFGNTNGAETESREYDTYRFAFNFEGPLTEEIDYSTSLNYSSSTGLTTSSDTQQGKFLAALWGYGGPTCDAEITAKTTSASDLTPTFVVKSTGAAIAANDVNAASRPAGCSYLNATSNAIQQAMQPNQTTGERVGVNPDYDATLANSPELIRWLVDKRYTESTSDLITADFIMQGTMGMLAGGDAAWAFGYERRDYNIKTTLPILPGPTATNALTNIHDGNLYPCEMPRDNATKAGRDACASNPVGLFMFLAPTFEEDQNQTVDSLFAEFALPITDDFDMQLALRYEDYGSKDSVDPKMVMRWTPIPSLTLRFTGQTTFRAAHPDEMSSTRTTALQFVNQAGAFKAVDISGNANLDPEEATTYNFGFVTDFGTLESNSRLL